MESQTGQTPVEQENTHQTTHPTKVPDIQSSPILPAGPSRVRKKSLSRALQGLLNTPHPPEPAVSGRSGVSSRASGSRNPVAPLFSSPLRISSSAMASAPSSPERHHGDANQPRRSLDLADDRRTSTGILNGHGTKSDAPSSLSGQNLPKKHKPQARKSVASMMSGLESRLFPKSFTRGRDASRGSSRRGSSVDSRSPSASKLESESSSSLNTTSNTDMNKRSSFVISEEAHNQSDEALNKPAGGLPEYVKPSEENELGERLAKDVFDRDKNIIESSEEEESSSDEEHDGHRGRKKKVDVTFITPNDFKPHDDTSDGGRSIKSVDTAPEKKPRKSALKSVIRPQTSFDIPTPMTQSAAGTPYGSDDEAERDDIHRAQRLTMSMSAIDNQVPHRSIRTIIRGDFAAIQAEGDEGRRRQRKYVLATDLSEESVYALEWAIGTVLRDGDTLYCIHAMHEDHNASSSVQVGEGAKAMRDAANVVGTQTKEAAANPGRNLFGLLGPGTASKASSVDARGSPAAEAERVKAVEKVSETCVKLLRKTVLQVRVAVEVIQCRSPKLLVVEAIDELEPLLVIVGARGQNALKGVLLGSFSNYLLQNSSTPVMVARRKLKRNPSKGRQNASTIRMTNNLKTPKSLTQAKVD
ncbi:hypothetical protein N7468_007209 [Penicillium chermesinum]|uniref:UspA domain-containing protein n=1 Tax=Penicillium chermesinum TaxID=63820 RepID=A0A9W9NWK7_9EURO|nr:uncharacterized protein N7468_007209 [Penicillium chermesinum]KAJ5225984.1 hypothetical protein N7468_007209 [Penicillium chermesinum]